MHADPPALPCQEWADTCATLHRWAQIVGTSGLALTPRLESTHAAAADLAKWDRRHLENPLGQGPKAEGRAECL